MNNSLEKRNFLILLKLKKINTPEMNNIQVYFDINVRTE